VIKIILKVIDAMVWPLLIILAIWIVFFINLRFDLHLNAWGMHPREWRGIYGIFTMVFLHGDFDHLFSNTVPLLLAMGFIFTYFEKERAGILILNLLITGILLIFMGEYRSNHIGASGLVYAFIFFLVTHAFLTKNKEMLAASFILIFLYGSLIYGLFPDYGLLIGKDISWEGHLAGAISGVLTALYYRNQGPQRLTFFDDEQGNDDDDDELGYWNMPEEDETTVHYHYKEKE
jgi:membrane associated rhomboid family serine protease